MLRVSNPACASAFTFICFLSQEGVGGHFSLQDFFLLKAGEENLLLKILEVAQTS